MLTATWGARKPRQAKMCFTKIRRNTSLKSATGSLPNAPTSPKLRNAEFAVKNAMTGIPSPATQLYCKVHGLVGQKSTHFAHATQVANVVIGKITAALRIRSDPRTRENFMVNGQRSVQAVVVAVLAAFQRKLPCPSVGFAPSPWQVSPRCLLSRSVL